SRVSLPDSTNCAIMGLRPSPEKTQNLIEQTVASRVLRNQRFENIRVPDLPNTAHDFLRFHPIDGVRDRCVGRARLRKRLLNLPHRGSSLGPKGFQNAKFELGELKPFHMLAHLTTA